MRTLALRIVPVVAVFLSAGVVLAEDWPQWRGPDVTAVTQDEDFKPSFLKDGQPIVAWSRNVGTGYAPVTIVGHMALTAGWSNGKDTVYCLDAQSGEPIWTYSYDCEKFDRQHAGGPADSIAVYDDRAFHFTRDARLFCFDIDTGDLLWQRDIANEYKVKSPKWMFSGSAIVADERLYLDAGYILALNPEDGTEIWKTKNFGAAYGTPMPFALHGRNYLAAFPEAGLVIVDRDTGRVVATHNWSTSYGVNATTPIVRDDNVFISTGYDTGCAMLKLTGAGLQVVWESTDMRNKLASSVLIGDYIYGFDEKQLKCLALADGKQMWAQRGLGMGTLIARGDTLIVLSEDGELITAPASPDGFTPIARAQVLDSGNNWIMPTLANAKLYCRAPGGQLVCIETDPGAEAN